MAFDWKKIVKTVAPSIGTALGGPLAGMAVQAVSQAVLGKSDGSEDEIASGLQSASQETLLALKKADQDFKIRMKELEIDLTRLDYDDVKDARAREVALKDKMPSALAIVLLLMFAAALGVLFWVPIPEDNKSTVYMMLGSLGTLTIAGCQYFHGTTRGSAQKNAILQQPETKK
jgi:hypothetical protein